MRPNLPSFRHAAPKLFVALLVIASLLSVGGQLAAAQTTQPANSAPDAPSQATIARDAWRRAAASQRAGAADSSYADVRRAHEAWPEQTAYTEALARLAARRSDEAQVVRALNALAAQEAGAAAALDTAVVSFAGRSATVALARNALLERIGPTGGSTARVVSPDTAFWAEGLDADPRDGTLYVTSLFHRNVLVVPRTGAARWLLGEGEPTLGAVFGVAVDAARNVVWLTSASLAQLGGAAADTSRRAELLRVELATGRITARYLLGDGRGMPGEITVTPAGDVLVSDATLGALYRLRVGAERVERVTAALLRSPQGIAVSADGAWAIVADWSHGLLRWDLSSDAVERVAVPPNVTLLGIDGLRRAGDILVAVQNGVRPNRVVSMLLAPDGRKVGAVKTLDRPTVLEGEPTIGAVRGDRYLYVSSSAWPFWTEQGQRIHPERPLPPVVVREIALPR